MTLDKFISDIFNIVTIMATTIAVSSDTKENLRKFGEKGETFDQIIMRLMEDARWKKADERWNRILADDEFTPL